MTSEGYRPDREINYRVLTRLTVGLVVLVIVALILMSKFAGYLNRQEIAQDPPPPIMLEARVPHEPPNPRLQSEPSVDLDLWESAAEIRLSSYGWADEARGLAHIPIGRAMDLIAENGLPEIPVFDQTAEPEQED